MKKDLSILTEKQKIAYLLREQGLSYQRIADEMGITYNAARQNVKGAERRFQEYEKFQKEKERDGKPIEFPLTRGELEEIFAGLLLLEDDLFQQSTNFNIKTDWEGRLPYEIQIVHALSKRAQMALYGAIIFPSVLDK